jgi:hypothetical protein
VKICREGSSFEVARQYGRPFASSFDVRAAKLLQQTINIKCVR